MDASSQKRGTRASAFGSVIRRARAAAVLAVAGWLAACSPFAPVSDTTVQRPELSAIPPISIERKAMPLPPRRPPRPTGPVAVVVSQNIESYVGVATRLTELLGSDDMIVYLLDDERDSGEIAAAIAAERPRAVVGVGLPAALFASERLDVPVVFCQVFNFAEYPSLLETRGGVSVLPEFAAQLEVWSAADPNLKSIGAIVGTGHEDLIETSGDAAASYGLEFLARVSRSDQETVYQFKRLASEVDGFWLVPDNRILSMSAIREMLDYALGHDVRVVVSTPELLAFGALMSFTPSALHVADAVYELLGSIAKNAAGGFRLVSPTQFDVRVNPDVARHFGIGVN